MAESTLVKNALAGKSKALTALSAKIAAACGKKRVPADADAMEKALDAAIESGKISDEVIGELDPDVLAFMAARGLAGEDEDDEYEDETEDVDEEDLDEEDEDEDEDTEDEDVDEDTDDEDDAEEEAIEIDDEADEDEDEEEEESAPAPKKKVSATTKQPHRPVVSEKPVVPAATLPEIIPVKIESELANALVFMRSAVEAGAAVSVSCVLHLHTPSSGIPVQGAVEMTTDDDVDTELGDVPEEEEEKAPSGASEEDIEARVQTRWRKLKRKLNTDEKKFQYAKKNAFYRGTAHSYEKSGLTPRQLSNMLLTGLRKQEAAR